MGFPADRTWAFEDVYDGDNAHRFGFWGTGAERVASRTSARNVFAAAAKSPDV